jgi:hypothetical protein
VTRRLAPRLVALAAAIAAGSAAVSAGARAQSSGTTRAAILLTLPSGARALALGDAWGAVADDESALFYNPAQLARVTGPSMGLSVQRYVASTTLGAGAFATAFARGTVALGVQLLDYGSEDEVIPDAGFGGQVGVPTGGRVSAQDVAFTAGYGMALGTSRRLRLGFAVKLARQHVASVSGCALAADAGVGYSLGAWELDAALQHMGSSLALGAVRSPLPWTWRAGAAAPSISLGPVALRPMVEVRQGSGGAATGVVAAEGTWRAGRDGPSLALRGALSTVASGDDRAPLTFGGGLGLGRLVVDYAYEGFDKLGGATHRVGVRFAAPASAR